MNVQKLRAIPLLQVLSDEELNDLAQAALERTVKKNAHIIRAEEKSTSLMFIFSGTARVSLTGSDGKEIVLAHHSQGDFLGEIALLTGEDRSADVTAMEETSLIILTSEAFHAHVSKHPGLLLELSKQLARRLRSTSQQAGDLALLDVYRRVARTLKEIANEEERDGRKLYVIEKRPTHQELSAMVGTSREMVTRALKALEEDECIVMEGKRIEILSTPL